MSDGSAPHGGADARDERDNVYVAPPHGPAPPASAPPPDPSAPPPPPQEELPPEQDVGHQMHLTPYEDRIIRVVSSRSTGRVRFTRAASDRRSGATWPLGWRWGEVSHFGSLGELHAQSRFHIWGDVRVDLNSAIFANSASHNAQIEHARPVKSHWACSIYGCGSTPAKFLQLWDHKTYCAHVCSNRGRNGFSPNKKVPVQSHNSILDQRSRKIIV